MHVLLRLTAQLLPVLDRIIALQQLQRLSDHLLEDIGLERADLDAGTVVFRQREVPLRVQRTVAVRRAPRPSLQGCG